MCVQKDSMIRKVRQREVMCLRCMGCVHKQRWHKRICHKKVNRTPRLTVSSTNLSMKASNIAKGSRDRLQEYLTADLET